ncbi:hypothetical protein [Methanobacterium alcaliphilum]|uniref:hypothetical protein n=1 Tax=Methanobacterium alcaliphilum TaxID=392018 RepID=UPI00200A5966|nr:hypothetical protein [Methanobacterium alcaliphilum]MCK9150972.1 hypothetical protein [Methanobacterium alcaliphilum]
MPSEKDQVDENIVLLKQNFKSIADITVSFERYDIILYDYNELEEINRFIKEETDIKSWTTLKTRIGHDYDLEME